MRLWLQTRLPFTKSLISGEYLQIRLQSFHSRPREPTRVASPLTPRRLSQQITRPLELRRILHVIPVSLILSFSALYRLSPSLLQRSSLHHTCLQSLANQARLRLRMSSKMPINCLHVGGVEELYINGYAAGGLQKTGSTLE